MRQRNSDYKNDLRFNFCDFSLRFQKIITRNFSSADDFFENPNKITLTKKQHLKLERSKSIDWKKLFDILEGLNVNLVSIDDDEYPEELKTIYSPPLLLYVRGNVSLLQKKKFSIVGSRKVSPYGKSIALDFSQKIASTGQVVVSGLAMGIDSFAHKGSLKSGKTIAVMATGIDICYPSFNKVLIDRIIENGAVITECFPGTQPEPYRFPIRNRIISGLSWGTLVVEARIKSGSLITAKSAIDQGREVFAIPGDIGKLYCQGTNYLIKNAMAHIVIDINDILPYRTKREIKLSQDEEKIFNLIREGVMSFDDLLEVGNFDFGKLSGILFQLELKGLILKVSNNSYRGVENGI